MNSMWGIHNDTLTTELVDRGFVSIGWDELGDLRGLGRREDLKRALSETYPDRKPAAIAGWAGILLRFRDEMRRGDVVVAPYKPDSTINIGVISGEYDYVADAETHRHRRSVDWKQLGVSRTVFSQPALYELGAFLTVFRIRKHADEFRALLSVAPSSVEDAEKFVDSVAALTLSDDSPDVPRASRIDRHTRDFVLETLHRRISHQEFEEFTAALLRALGYQARVTRYSYDGGVDVIAHSDPLGVEPPLIKVQCKHYTGTVGAPEVQQLIGIQGNGELSLFVTLGAFSREALAIERSRPGLRLLDGEGLVDLILQHYSELAPRWRVIIPLTSVLVVDDAADS